MPHTKFHRLRKRFANFIYPEQQETVDRLLQETEDMALELMDMETQETPPTIGELDDQTVLNEAIKRILPQANKAYDYNTLPKNHKEQYLEQAEILKNSPTLKNEAHHLVQSWLHELLTEKQVQSPEQIKQVQWATLGIQLLLTQLDSLPQRQQNEESQYNIYSAL